MSQGTNYFIFDLPSQSEKFGESLIDYTSRVPRKNSLDSLSSLRVDYFLGVLKESAKGRSLEELYRRIPADERAHYPLFSDSSFFKNPCCVDYTSPLVKITKERISGKAEIMQQTICWEKRKKRISKDSLPQIMIGKIINSFGEDYILDGYKESKSHNDVIKKYCKQTYGTSTKILISERYDTKSKCWVYEGIVYNSTIFGKSY